MITEMIAAASLARKASTLDGSRTVEIVLTEEGLIVRGRVLVGVTTRKASRDVEWPVFEQAPHLLLNAVQLVDLALNL